MGKPKEKRKAKSEKQKTKTKKRKTETENGNTKKRKNRKQKTEKATRPVGIGLSFLFDPFFSIFSLPSVLLSDNMVVTFMTATDYLKTRAGPDWPSFMHFWVYLQRWIRLSRAFFTFLLFLLIFLFLFFEKKGERGLLRREKKLLYIYVCKRAPGVRIYQSMTRSILL